ncbi:hypothetical protein JL720_642 [Aureococcus anophagefferens]|nr:hypothetical protein JL720_642 [Aureococcus anophagefferens]
MTEPPPMTDTAKKRLAVLEKLKSVDDATKQEREAQLSLRRKLTKAREEARARSRRAADLDREWRCAQIAARRLELERAQKKLDDAREREDAAREAGRASSLAAGEARRRALRGERAALEGERDALALGGAVDAKGRLSRARLVEAELKAGDAGDDDAREALERLVLGPSSALPTLPTLSTPSAADDDVEQAMFADVVEGDFTPRVDDVAAPPYPAAAAETTAERPATPDGGVLREAEGWLAGSTTETLDALARDVEASGEEVAWAAGGPWDPLTPAAVSRVAKADAAQLAAAKDAAAAKARDLDRLEAYDAIFDRGRAGEWASRGGVLELAARDAADDIADEATRSVVPRRRYASGAGGAAALLGAGAGPPVRAARGPGGGRRFGGRRRASRTRRLPADVVVVALGTAAGGVGVAAAPCGGGGRTDDEEERLPEDGGAASWAFDGAATAGAVMATTRFPAPIADVALDAAGRRAVSVDAAGVVCVWLVEVTAALSVNSVSLETLLDERALRGRAADVWPDVFPVAARVDDGGRAPGALDDDDAWARRDDAPRLWISTRGGPLARWQCVLPPPPPPPEKPKKGWFGSSKKKAAPAPPEPTAGGRPRLDGPGRRVAARSRRVAALDGAASAPPTATAAVLFDAAHAADDVRGDACQRCLAATYDVAEDRSLGARGSEARYASGAARLAATRDTKGRLATLVREAPCPVARTVVLDVAPLPDAAGLCVLEHRGADPGDVLAFDARVASVAFPAAGPRVVAKATVAYSVPRERAGADPRTCGVAVAGGPRAFAGAFFLDDGD